MKHPIIFILDKGQNYNLNTGDHSKLNIIMKEGDQDYGLVISGDDFEQTVTMDNITEPISFPQDSDLNFHLKNGSTNISYTFELEWI